MTEPTSTGAPRQVRPADDGAAPSSLPTLSFAVPRRGKPPQHLADLDEAGRAAVLVEMGHPGFRAKQIRRTTSPI